MKIKSKFLRELANNDFFLDDIECINFFTYWDLMVFPGWWSAKLPEQMVKFGGETRAGLVREDTSIRSRIEVLEQVAGAPAEEGLRVQQPHQQRRQPRAAPVHVPRIGVEAPRDERGRHQLRRRGRAVDGPCGFDRRLLRCWRHRAMEHRVRARNFAHGTCARAVSLGTTLGGSVEGTW